MAVKDKKDELDLLADAGDDEEEFTDLHGNVDEAEDADDEASIDGLDELDEALNLKDGDKAGDEEEDGPEDEETDEETVDADPEPTDVREPETGPSLETLNARLETISTKAQLLETHEKAAKQAKIDADAALPKLKERWKAAKEAGDADAEFNANEEMLKASNTIRDADQRLTQIETGKGLLRQQLDEIGYDPATKSFRMPEGQVRRAVPSKLAPAFLKANPWIAKAQSDPRYKPYVSVLGALDRALAAEGKLDKNKPEYFAELGRRFNATKPGLIRGLDGKLVATGSRQRGNGAGSTGGLASAGATRSTNGGDAGSNKMTEADKKQMTIYGFNPKDKNHRANWLREKVALNRGQRARA